MKVRWNSLDCLKGIACIAVVLIHFNFPGNLGIAVKSFCRFAVPVFLIISGFFFLSNNEMDDVKVLNKIRHILYLLLVSALFYAAFVFFDYGFLNQDWNIISFIKERLTGGKIVKLLLTNDPFVYSHLWYMLALVYCYTFCLLAFSKNRSLKGVEILGVLLLIGYTCLQEFGSILHIKTSLHIISTDQSLYFFNLFIFRALPFFLIGVSIRKHLDKLTKIPFNKIVFIVIFVFGGVLAAFEHLYINNAQFFVGNYIMVFVLVIMAIKNPAKEYGLLSFIGRELSLYVYIFHIAVGKTIHIIARIFGIAHRKFYLYSRAAIIVCTTLLLAYCIYKVINMIKENKIKKSRHL